ncbi:hypothetical protein BJ165DRAFT_1484563 [Panaeolus papilionaceus]|nr:hypothetical protein BJ165DRAFT_1484563 [Panaeolus papilionaceus]
MCITLELGSINKPGPGGSNLKHTLDIMNTEDYLRILASIAVAYYFAAALISPNPIMKSTERAKLGGILDSTEASGQHMCMILVALSSTLWFAEVTSLLARDIPRFAALHVGATWIFSFEGTDTITYLTPTHTLGAFMVVTGGIIRLWTFRALGRFFTFQVGVQKGHRLIKHGLYSVVRHPSYAALLLTLPGFLLWHLTPGSWVWESGLLDQPLGCLLSGGLVIWLIAIIYMVCFTRAPQEDKVMKDAFGKEWVEWAKDVPYRILPGIY